ncbi:MAG: patatin-like phospholipase family protein [Acidimicrobiales bacterium]
MTPAASDTLFYVVFGVFVVVSLVLIVLVIRFTLSRAALARARWLDADDVDLESGDVGGDTSHQLDGRSDHRATALVLAGGGTRGAVQIGMLQVLAEHNFVPDRIYGCSVGAVNGTAYAADPSREWVEHMTEVWLALDRDRVYPQGRLHGPWAYVRQRDSVYPNSGLRSIVEDGVPYDRLEDATIPVEVVATSLTDGRERWFTYGPVVDAVLASSAVPAIFPPVEIDGERYIDGGVVNNVPIRRAIDVGATRIVVLLCTPPTYVPVVPRRPAESILNALWIAVHARFARDISHLPPGVEVIVCSGTEPGDREFDDFSTTEKLIAEGRREAEEVVARYGLGSTVPIRPRPRPVPPVPPEPHELPEPPETSPSLDTVETSGGDALAPETRASEAIARRLARLRGQTGVRSRAPSTNDDRKRNKEDGRNYDREITGSDAGDQDRVSEPASSEPASSDPASSGSPGSQPRPGT